MVLHLDFEDAAGALSPRLSIKVLLSEGLLITEAFVKGYYQVFDNDRPAVQKFYVCFAPKTFLEAIY